MVKWLSIIRNAIKFFICRRRVPLGEPYSSISETFLITHAKIDYASGEMAVSAHTQLCRI